jgi:hypothetical protein
MVNSLFKIRKLSKVRNNDQIALIFRSRMNKLVYIFVPNEFVIGQVVLKLLIKRLAVAVYDEQDSRYVLSDYNVTMCVLIGCTMTDCALISCSMLAVL